MRPSEFGRGDPDSAEPGPNLENISPDAIEMWSNPSGFFLDDPKSGEFGRIKPTSVGRTVHVPSQGWSQLAKFAHNLRSLVESTPNQAESSPDVAEQFRSCRAYPGLDITHPATFQT